MIVKIRNNIRYFKLIFSEIKKPEVQIIKHLWISSATVDILSIRYYPCSVSFLNYFRVFVVNKLNLPQKMNLKAHKCHKS